MLILVPMPLALLAFIGLWLSVTKPWAVGLKAPVA